MPAGPVVLSVLHPGLVPLTGTSADDNNDGLVLRLDYGQTGFLLAGDAEQEAEAALLAAAVPLRADVLKVGHHGSGRSTSAPFVAAVAPQVAVVQVGAENRFGHPQPATSSAVGRRQDFAHRSGWADRDRRRRPQSVWIKTLG